MTWLVLVAALSCGTERQAVKVLDDGVLPQGGGPVTIQDLRRFPAPAWRVDLPRQPLEDQQAVVEGWLMAYRREADQDLHVVLGDERGRTIVVEYPAPACAQRPVWRRALANARAEVERLLPRPASPKLTWLARYRRVRVTGVVHFDKVHGQAGVAPNGVELHPVLRTEVWP